MQVARLEEELQRERERGEAVALKLRQLQHTHIGTALPLYEHVCIRPYIRQHTSAYVC